MRGIAGHVHIPAEMELAITKSIMSINMRLIAFGNTVHTGRRKEMEEEKDVKKIVIHYEDGTEKVIDKGFFCNMKEEDGSAVLEFTMCHVSGREIELIVEGCLQLGFKLGMFDDKKEEE